ncbi:beta-ketoacyl synthase N-terminal-like domain-containing protein [Streptomyces griseoincarnatus]
MQTVDHKDILTRFKNGDLGREQAAALLTGAHPDSAARHAPLTTAVAPPRAAVSQPPPARALTTAPAGGGPPLPADGYAITALHGRFPDADGLDAFWHTAVLGGRDAGRRTSGSPGGAGAGAGDFDAVFFGLTPQDAAVMDPQERLLLEVLWQTLETAGCTGARLDTLTAADGEPRAVGVYVAHDPLGRAAVAQAPAGDAPAAGAGVTLPARLSTLLDLRGPGHCVGGGGAAFLVALHQALSALRAGECGAALVGAVGLQPGPARRHPQGAEGGQGVGAVLLRPLAAALAAGDTVHAVVRATAVAHPGRRAREAAADRLARRALAAAGVTAAGVGLRETETTVAATTGDTGAATGLAALVRAVLQLRHGTLLPAPGDSSAAPWARPHDQSGRELPRRATVAVRPTAGSPAAHVLLEEPPRRGPEPIASGPAGPAAASGELVLLSAPTPEHLAATARLLADRVLPADAVEHGTQDGRRLLAALARELRLGRAMRDCRLAVVARDTGELGAALRAFAEDQAGAGDQDRADDRAGAGDRDGVGGLDGAGDRAGAGGLDGADDRAGAEDRDGAGDGDRAEDRDGAGDGDGAEDRDGAGGRDGAEDRDGAGGRDGAGDGDRAEDRAGAGDGDRAEDRDGADDRAGAGAGGARGSVRCADLRGAQGPGVLFGELPETRAYLAALWRGRRLDALARLWLAGVDVSAADTAGAAPVLALPTSALLRRPLREAGCPATDGPTPS